MALAKLNSQIEGFVESMYNEGMLDHQFKQLQQLQDANNSGFVAEMIDLFCMDTDRIIIELNSYLKEPVVDYHKLDACVHQLKGSSSRDKFLLRTLERPCSWVWYFRQLYLFLSDQASFERLLLSMIFRSQQATILGIPRKVEWLLHM